ncbi:hypothetical protein [uncultured Castellaniella sp.]|uniref:hypothetical protein n=1 Tax=uncultured Castellaniella sp. TaxID=647907 RepID=UPI002607D5DC|nr:hypothetical protein [uncultured Castellaniella sp.]
MTPEDEKKIADLIRAARANKRGYADFYSWSTDRDIEEWGVTTELWKSLQATGESFFDDIKRRGRGNDPPDCEAVDYKGNRIAIEVTELVCPDAIRAYNDGRVYDWADWPKKRFIDAIAHRIATKGDRYGKLRGGPYEGGYVVLIFTDEPMLPIATVRKFLDGHVFSRPEGVTRVFLLLSYDPGVQMSPYVELTLGSLCP